MISYHSEYSNLDFQCLTFTHTDKAHDILPFWVQQSGLPVSDIHTYWQSSWYLTILSTAIWTSNVWHSHMLTKLMIMWSSFSCMRLMTSCLRKASCRQSTNGWSTSGDSSPTGRLSSLPAKQVSDHICQGEFQLNKAVEALLIMQLAVGRGDKLENVDLNFSPLLKHWKGY